MTVVCDVFYIFQQDGATALIEAARNGHLAVVETLLTAGADFNLRDEVSNDGVRIVFAVPLTRTEHISKNGVVVRRDE